MILYYKAFLTFLPLIKWITGTIFAKCLNLMSGTFALAWLARYYQGFKIPAEFIIYLALTVFILTVVRIVSTLILRETYGRIFGQNR